jgi:dTDP-4-dehydrorhamnose reductase
MSTWRYLITGGGGMLAHAFEQLLQARHLPYVALARNACDITDADHIAQALSQHQPAVLINCAAYTKVDLAEKEAEQANRINASGAAAVAKACAESGTTLVHFSTDYVFDGTLRRPLRIDDPVGPRSAYGRSKLLGEQAIQQTSGLKWLIIRTAWLYGPNGHSFPQTIANLARQGKPLNVVDDQVGSPTFTFDLAAATLDLLDVGARGIFHVTNTGETTWHDFAAAILEEFGLETELTRTTSAAWKQQRPESATRPAYSVLDTSDYTRGTGQTLRHWREALREYRDIVTSSSQSPSSSG